MVVVSVSGGHLEHVVATKPGRKQGLMGVTKSRVGEKEFFFSTHLARKSIGSHLEKPCPASVGGETDSSTPKGGAEGLDGFKPAGCFLDPISGCPLTINSPM